MSICMPSENPDLDGILASEVQGTISPADELEHDTSSASVSTKHSEVREEDIPALLSEAIGKFCALEEDEDARLVAFAQVVPRRRPIQASRERIRFQ